MSDRIKELSSDDLFAGCKQDAHDLQTIYGEYGVGPCISNIVRWCAICGSVVVDRDDAGRTLPGAIMKMKSPEIAKRLLKK